MPEPDLTRSEERSVGARLDGCTAVRPTFETVGLRRIFGAFFWLGCTSFGGGSAGWLYREMVQRRRWIDDEAFLAAMALAQVMPGANGVKLSILIGQRL